LRKTPQGQSQIQGKPGAGYPGNAPGDRRAFDNAENSHGTQALQGVGGQHGTAAPMGMQGNHGPNQPNGKNGNQNVAAPGGNMQTAPSIPGTKPFQNQGPVNSVAGPGSNSASTGKCANKADSCCGWAEIGQCDSNPFWMRINCAAACGTCGATLYNAGEVQSKPGSGCKGNSGPSGPIIPPPKGPPFGTPDCPDQHELCNYWASIGDCEKNPTWMRPNCQKACKACGAGKSGGMNGGAKGPSGGMPSVETRKPKPIRSSNIPEFISI